MCRTYCRHVRLYALSVRARAVVLLRLHGQQKGLPLLCQKLRVRLHTRHAVIKTRTYFYPRVRVTTVTTTDDAFRVPRGAEQVCTRSLRKKGQHKGHRRTGLRLGHLFLGGVSAEVSATGQDGTNS